MESVEEASPLLYSKIPNEKILVINKVLLQAGGPPAEEILLILVAKVLIAVVIGLGAILLGRLFFGTGLDVALSFLAPPLGLTIVLFDIEKWSLQSKVCFVVGSVISALILIVLNPQAGDLLSKLLIVLEVLLIFGLIIYALNRK